MLAYHLKLLLLFHRLVQLAETRRPLVVGVSDSRNERGARQWLGTRGAVAARAALRNHFSGRGDSWIRQLEVHEDLGAPPMR